jgi:2-polyprenyl-3-methyl-5-hydroxy-6-metoxy-1,4-benzoquinol methylase
MTVEPAELAREQNPRGSTKPNVFCPKKRLENGVHLNMEVDTVKKAQWTEDEIVSFWKYESSRTDRYYDYWGNWYGSGVVEFLRESGTLHPGIELLDYGCGPGFLLRHLLDAGANCSAIDASENAITHVNREFSTYRNWKGGVVASVPPTPFPSENFSLITCTETIEHLPDAWLDALFREVYRLLKPGGAVCFTTPNSEDLTAQDVFCPFCKTEFHRYQHVRSFTAESLKTQLLSYSYRVVFCDGLNLANFQSAPANWRAFNCSTLKQFVWRLGATALDALHSRPFPFNRSFRVRAKPGRHLVALAMRP